MAPAALASEVRVRRRAVGAPPVLALLLPVPVLALLAAVPALALLPVVPALARLLPVPL
jgi:hypothetical protein